MVLRPSSSRCRFLSFNYLADEEVAAVDVLAVATDSK